MSSLTTEDADNAVNTMALVAALLLTIPFSLVGSLNQEYWDDLAETINGCKPAVPAESSPQAVFMTVFRPLNALVYFSMGAIMLAVFYFLLRPSENDMFEAWWKRGRFALALILVSAVSAVVCAFTVYNTLVAGQVFMGFSDNICEIARVEGATYERYLAAVIGGMFTIIILVVVAAAFMF
jgi:hypothetical protein